MSGEDSGPACAICGNVSPATAWVSICESGFTVGTCVSGIAPGTWVEEVDSSFTSGLPALVEPEFPVDVVVALTIKLNVAVMGYSDPS